mgnify:CR=1 FL=1
MAFCYDIPMTKYILHGGLSIEDNTKNSKFYQEIFKGITLLVTILMVYFARADNKRQELFNIHKKLLVKNNPDQEINFVYASDDIEEFREQVKQAQIMFVEGGSSERLIKHFQQLSDIKELIQSVAVYVGSSAGASIIAQYAYPSTDDQIQERLGILPIKIINHYDDTKADRLQKLESMHPELKTYALVECEFIVMM